MLFLIIVFLSGLYFYISAHPFAEVSKETMENVEETRPNDAPRTCPNLLIQRGNILLLYDTTRPNDESNPIRFSNLDEYIYYVDMQRSKGDACPILYLQQETNAQGEDVYRARPSPFDLQGGLPPSTELYPPKPVKIVDANREHPPYNANNYAGFDPYGQNVGQYTTLDAIHDSTSSKEVSDNPMDANWAGVTYTQQMVDSGKYDENVVTRPVLYTPKTGMYPMTGSIPLPKDVI